MKKMLMLAAMPVFLAVILAPARFEAAKGRMASAGVGTVVHEYYGKANLTYRVGACSLLDVGYGFNQYFAVGGFLSGDFSYWDYVIGDIGVGTMWTAQNFGAYCRVTIPAGKDIEFYTDAGIGAYHFPVIDWDEGEINVTQLGWRIGGGLNWFLGGKYRWFIGPGLGYNYIPDYDNPLLEFLFKFGGKWRK